MKVLIGPGESGHVLATIAIGDEYFRVWEEFAYPTWAEYCARHGLGLVVFEDHLISEANPAWKKPTWQKLLIGDVISATLPAVTDVCYLDTDILVNPTAPNIFGKRRPDAISLVSLRRRLPYPYHDVLRRLAFLRHTYYSRSYPLDSALFISVEQLYQYHGLPPQPDEACAGLIAFNVARHAELMRGWFFNFDRHVSSITGGGDQTHVNYLVQSHGEVDWLDYRFQAIWAFEMAWKYPFLYAAGRYDENQIKACIEASLFTNFFLHFAGSWEESGMWKLRRVLDTPQAHRLFSEFSDYTRQPVIGQPVGVVRQP